MEEFKFTWIILLRNHPTREFREPFGVDTDIFGDIREGLLEYQQPEASKRYILLGIPHFYGFPVCWSCCRTQPDRDFVIRDHQGGMFDMVDMGRCKDGNMICFVEVLSWKHTNETTHTHIKCGLGWIRLNTPFHKIFTRFPCVSWFQCHSFEVSTDAKGAASTEVWVTWLLAADERLSPPLPWNVAVGSQG